jgi:hypothetical protein
MNTTDIMIPAARMEETDVKSSLRNLLNSRFVDSLYMYYGYPYNEA